MPTVEDLSDRGNSMKEYLLALICLLGATARPAIAESAANTPPEEVCTGLLQKDEELIKSDRLYAYSYLAKSKSTRDKGASWKSAASTLYDGLPVGQSNSADWVDTSYFDSLTDLNWSEEERRIYSSAKLSSANAKAFTDCVGIFQLRPGLHLLVAENGPDYVKFHVTFGAYGGGPFYIRAKVNDVSSEIPQLSGSLDGRYFSKPFMLSRQRGESLRLELWVTDKSGSSVAIDGKSGDAVAVPYPWKITLTPKKIADLSSPGHPASSAQCNATVPDVPGNVISISTSDPRHFIAQYTAVETAFSGLGRGPLMGFVYDTVTPNFVSGHARCNSVTPDGNTIAFVLKGTEYAVEVSKE